MQVEPVEKTNNDSSIFSSFQCCSSQTELTIQTQNSAQIDKIITGEVGKRVAKLLLLGPEQSGKSTFVKQMQ
jgi:polynucleotide 5'-kinase involved in rRNA processing